MRRILIIIIVVIVLAGGGYYFYEQQVSAQEESFEILRQAEAKRESIQATVNATGSIEPEALVSLTFGVSGMVQQIAVQRGEMVEEGEVLATLNADELALALEQANDNLRIQELTLAQRLNSEASVATLAAAQADVDAARGNLAVSEANLASARAAVQQAQAQVAQLQAGPNAGEVASAQAEVTARQAEFETVRRQYDELTNAGVGGVPEENLRGQRDAAETALQAAEARLSALQSGARPADLQAAYANVSSAQAQVQASEANVLVAEANIARAEAAYQQLLEPPTEEEMDVLEAQVAAAETNVELAQLRLEQALITAPMAGKVANILVDVGEQAAPGATAVVLVNEGAYHIEVNVDEIDIDQITVGQEVDITLDALPDRTLSGRVADVAPTSSEAGTGVVTYLVTINIPSADTPLRPGMSANASIVVREVDAVLIVPNWAIRLDRDSGEAFVNRLETDGTVTEVIVETGLRNEQYSQVLTGLEAGDVVVVTDQREGFSFFGN